MNEGLVALLYVLLRDEVVAGRIEQLVADHVEKSHGQHRQYSNPHLEAYARELAGRISKACPEIAA